MFDWILNTPLSRLFPSQHIFLFLSFRFFFLKSTCGGKNNQAGLVHIVLITRFNYCKYSRLAHFLKTFSFVNGKIGSVITLSSYIKSKVNGFDWKMEISNKYPYE